MLSVTDPPPPAMTRWREPTYWPTPVYSSKSKDPYLLAPFYRNVMPPPPMILTDPRGRNDFFPCHCRSKSMEDVRTDVVEIRTEGAWQKDEDVNRYSGSNGSSGKHPLKNSVYINNRRSTDNLLADKPSRGWRAGRQVE